MRLGKIQEWGPAGNIRAWSKRANSLTRFTRRTLLGEDQTKSYCVSCHVVYRATPPNTCPRCGADNHTWRRWTQADLPAQFRHFFLSSPWGWLALSSLLLPLVGWGVFDFEPRAYQNSVLLLSFLLSLAGLFFLFLRREDLWLYELTRRIVYRPQGHFTMSYFDLLAVGKVGLLIFVAVGAILLGAIGASAWQGEALQFTGPMRWIILLFIGLVFTTQTWGAGIFSLFVYGDWLSDTFPAPIFMDEGHLLALVTAEARLRLRLKLHRHKKVAMQILSVTRTAQGGLELDIRAEMPTQKVAPDKEHFLIAVEYWRVISDRWGKIKHLAQTDPVDYIPDLERPYTPSETEKPVPALKGELLFLEDNASASMEEAIINAVIATGYKRRPPEE